jgi:hypothetical protein
MRPISPPTQNPAVADVTAVQLRTRPAVCTVTFGTYSQLQVTERGRFAIFGPRKIVAYLVQAAPYRALYLFRTTPPPDTAQRLRGVSAPVDLLYVADTRRRVDKTMAALRFLKGEIGEAAIDTLPDIFWLRLADSIDRRGGEIVYYVRSLLDYRDPLDLKGPLDREPTE